MSRRNQVLAGVLVVQLLVAAVLLWPQGVWPRAAQVSSGAPMFNNLDQVTQMTIRDGEGQEIRMRRSDIWVLPDMDDFVVQSDKVQAFLDKLGQLKADRLVTQTASSHRRLKVAEDEFERQIVLEWADGATHTLYLGTSPSYSVIHIRLDRQAQVYLANLSTTDVGSAASSWIDTLYLSLAQDQIVALTLENANGKFEFTKDADGKWSLAGLAAGETFKESGVTTLAGQMAGLRLVEPLGKMEKPEYGMQTPAAVVTAMSRDADGNSRTYTLRIGSKDDQSGNYVAISSESPYFVRIASYAADGFVSRTRSDFLELPPTPAPQS